MIRQSLPGEFGALAEVQTQHEEELFDKPYVVGVALGNKISGGEDTGERALTVLVEAKVDADLLKQDDLVPASIEGVTTDVQEVGIIQAGGPAGVITHEVDLAALERAPADGAALREEAWEAAEAPAAQEVGPLLLRTRMRPAMGGFSCGHFRVTAGTIATGCYDAGALPGIPSRYYMLSNNHVLANSNFAAIGDPCLQPGVFDGGAVATDTIGRLARFVPIKYRTPTTAPRNFVDAAIAQVDFHNLNREIYWIGYVRRLYAAPTVGMIVQKTGRTTNFTTGRVTNINATVDVNYGSGRVARFARQILTTNMSAGGDSGSLVTNLDEDGVGLLFAGSSVVTVINHLNFVQALLGIRITER